jgi:integral membrane protein
MELVKSNLGRLRIIALLEGVSFLLLMFIAVPLKYVGGYEHATQEIGMAHGLLFILYIFLVIPVQSEFKWNKRTTFLVLLASVLPFGTFVADARIFSKEQSKVSSS